MGSAWKSMWLLVLVLCGSGSIAVAADSSPASLVAKTDQATFIVAQNQLPGLQARLDGLKQQVSLADTLSQLVSLQDLIQTYLNDVERQQSALLPVQAQLQAQLGVLGPASADEQAPENTDIAIQRIHLIEQKDKLDSSLKTLAGLKASATELTTQIAALRRSLLESEVTQRINSILSPNFWRPLIAPQATDRQRLSAVLQEIGATLASVWQPGQRLVSSLLLLLALAVWTLGRSVAERGLFWVCIHRMPEGRLRRSSLALASILATLLTAACALQLLFYVVTRQLPLTPMLQSLAEEIEKLVYTCVLITGLSRALLSTRHPSWRLPAIADPVALAMEHFPQILAGVLLVLVTLSQIANVSGMSPQAVIFGRGVTALIVTVILAILLLRTSKIRRTVAASGEAPEAGTTLAGLMYAFASLAIVVSMLALLIGYISLARFITYEIVWIFIVFSGFYLLIQLFKDLCEYLFSPRQASGKALKQLLGIGDARLEQVSTVLSGVGRASMLLFALIALLVGGVGTTFGQLFAQALEILGGAGLRKLNIIPGHLLNAVLALLIGVYLIRSLRRWLDNEFLPKTAMDPGMCASLSTLFANIGYALVILLTLSSLGVQWTNLAWIVSALSVGIGFGLQEIVKNFVSGLILLTERPVKVGDLISISGVEGDIRRINVRATEIQLSDRSIVIVPNSQLISQNLRNVTLGGSAQGVATLELTFALDIDPEQVNDLLFNTYCEHENILDHPAPFVRFSKLTPDGITLTVTGYVSSPRVVGKIKSDLLFEILKRLSAAGISLAKPAATE